jgi:hypothetical protein
VNWEFDVGALKELMDRRKDNGDLQFNAGALRVPTAELNRIIEKWDIAKQFGYEHKEEKDNPYHGNLRFHASMQKALRHTVCGALARQATLIRRHSPPAENS